MASENTPSIQQIVQQLQHTEKEQTEQRLVTAIVIGAGNRGQTYASYAQDYPTRLQIVAVADPRPFQRNTMQKLYNIPEQHVYTDWLQVAALPKFADCVIIATPDALHVQPTVAFAKLGYHILLEKPMAVTEQDCQAITQACQQNQVMLAVCHVLRYTPANRIIAALIQSQIIGELIHIQHMEPIGYFHFAHSYVRGNWRNQQESTFSLMAKSCHDIDLIRYWAGTRKVDRVSSFGSLQHFRADKAPVNSTDRCVDCPLQDTCAYSATQIYLDAVKSGVTGWPVKVVCDDPTPEKVLHALETGPYGRCAYKCDNDVVDHQVVNFEFEAGVTASFSMIAFTEKICQRQTTIMGSKGQITCTDERSVSVFDFSSQGTTVIPCSPPPAHTRLTGHGGADFFLIHNFTKAVALNDASYISTGAEDALSSHMLVFSAEKSRLSRSVLEL